MAQQVRRAAALTAELAAQSEKKTAAVCDQPPGLDELAGHIEAPNMGAGGSHPQATMMPDPWATSGCPSASESKTKTSASPKAVVRVDTNRRSFSPTRGSRGARVRSVTRAPSTHPRGQNWINGEVQRRRLAEEKQQLQDKKEEAWELFQRQPNWGAKRREDFEREYKQKVVTEPLYSPFASDKREEKFLQEWVDELRERAVLSPVLNAVH